VNITPQNQQKIGSKGVKVFAHPKNDALYAPTPDDISLCPFFNSQKFCGNLYYINIDKSYIKNKKIFKRREYKGTVKNDNKLKNKNDVWYDSNYEFAGYKYGVYEKAKEGLYLPILDRLLKILHYAREKWKRVVCIRIDLHHKGKLTNNNDHISKFIKNLQRRLERKYKHKFLYTWVREVGELECGQHYHIALFFNGNRVRTSHNINKISKEIWESGNKECFLYVPKNCYYFINNQDIMEKDVYRVSYLAKIDTKGQNPSHINDYSSSRIGKYEFSKFA
jgi:hypothetical protein